MNQALTVYAKEPIYCNEEARTCFILGQLYGKMGDSESAKKSSDRAEQLRERILGVPDSLAAVEEDFDELIMFWSR